MMRAGCSLVLRLLGIHADYRSGFLDGLQGIRRIRSLTIDAAGQGILRNVNGDVFLPSAGLAVLEQIQLSVSYTG